MLLIEFHYCKILNDNRANLVALNKAKTQLFNVTHFSVNNVVLRNKLEHWNNVIFLALT